jgi:hypothetical protein
MTDASGIPVHRHRSDHLGLGFRVYGFGFRVWDRQRSDCLNADTLCLACANAERFLAAGGRELIEQALETHGQGPNGVRDCAVSCLSFLLQDVGSEEGNPPTLVSLDD